MGEEWKCSRTSSEGEVRRELRKYLAGEQSELDGLVCTQLFYESKDKKCCQQKDNPLYGREVWVVGMLEETDKPDSLSLRKRAEEFGIVKQVDSKEVDQMVDEYAEEVQSNSFGGHPKNTFRNCTSAEKKGNFTEMIKQRQ